LGVENYSLDQAEKTKERSRLNYSIFVLKVPSYHFDTCTQNKWCATVWLSYQWRADQVTMTSQWHWCTQKQPRLWKFRQQFTQHYLPLSSADFCTYTVCLKNVMSNFLQ